VLSGLGDRARERLSVHARQHLRAEVDVTPQVIVGRQPHVQVALDVEEQRLVERAVLEIDRRALDPEVVGAPAGLPAEHPRPVADAAIAVVDVGEGDLAAALARDLLQEPQDVHAGLGVRFALEELLDQRQGGRSSAVHQLVDRVLARSRIEVLLRVRDQLFVAAGVDLDGGTAHAVFEPDDRIVSEDLVDATPQLAGRLGFLE
jgi:hypothetical protein